MRDQSHKAAPPSIVRVNDLDPTAAELAHNAMPDGSHEWSDFAVLYVGAVASLCGALAARDAARDGTPIPDFYRRADIESIEHAAMVVAIDLDADLWRVCWRCYSAAANAEDAEDAS